MSLALSLHVLAVVIWVGGMVFAYMFLRPAAATLLEPPQRLTVWNGVFARFFPWVWACVAVILVSGYWMLLGPFGGFANAPLFVHTMNGLGLLMIVIYAVVFFVPYAQLRQAVAAQDWPAGGQALAKIRVLVGINMSIGLITIAIATAGKFFL